MSDVENFRNYARNISRTINNNGDDLDSQEVQVNTLISSEIEFRKRLGRYSQSDKIYKKFIYFVKNDLGNILSSNSYFRETNDIFRKYISKYIAKEDIKNLKKFNFNFRFVSFVKENWDGKFPVLLSESFDKIKVGRDLLVENNMPLAINRAKIFNRKNPQPHITLVDLIDICAVGLVAGIDKYVGPYTKVFRSVCIGRMVGYMIEESSQTSIKLSMSDKRVLYRALSLKSKMENFCIDGLTKMVNQTFAEEKKAGKKTPKLPIKTSHIASLINSSTIISNEDNKSENVGNTNNYSDYDESNTVYNMTASEENVEESVVNKDAMEKIKDNFKCLELIERKVIRLKGVEL